MNVERMYKEQRDDALAQVDRLARALAKQDPWLMTGPCVGCGLTGFEGGASQNTPTTASMCGLPNTSQHWRTGKQLLKFQPVYEFAALRRNGPKHAFIIGAGQGDMSICGRVGFPGRAHNGFGHCAHCTNGTRRPENAGPPAAHL